MPPLVPNFGVSVDHSKPRLIRATRSIQMLRAEYEQLRIAFPESDPLHVLLRVIGSDPVNPYLLLSLSEEFCRIGQGQPLVDLALTRQIALPAPEPSNDWLNSALLPFLVLSGDDVGVMDALYYLEHAPKGWQLSGTLAWLARHSARHFHSLPQARDRLLSWMRLSETQARDPWGRAACYETLNTTLTLLNERAYLSPELADMLPSFALRLYGLLPAFWGRLEQLDTPPDLLTQLHFDFEQIQKMVCQPDRVQADTALKHMDDFSVHGVRRFCLDLNRPDLCPPSVQEEINQRRIHFPARIWPSNLSAKDDLAAHPLTLIAGEDQLNLAQTAPIAVICVLRNERPILPAFLEHYRRLGVEVFLVADNGSEDGSAEWLAQQPDVVLFSVQGGFTETQQGTEWKQALMAQLRPNRWSLVADADEFLVAPNLRGPGHPQGWGGETDLPMLVQEAENQGWDALRILMLDLYPRGPLSQAQVSAQNPFATIGFADQVAFKQQHLDRGPFGDRTALRSGLRHRLLPDSAPNLFVSEKVALLRYRPWMRLSVSLHYAAGIQLAPEPLIFGHFKYTAQFHDKVARAIEEGQFFNNSAEYHRYAQLLTETGGQFFDPDFSVPWTQAMHQALQDTE